MVLGAEPLHFGVEACHCSTQVPRIACTKSELLVIADQHAAVNTFPGLVHTAFTVSIDHVNTTTGISAEEKKRQEEAEKAEQPLKE